MWFLLLRLRQTARLESPVPETEEQKPHRKDLYKSCRGIGQRKAMNLLRAARNTPVVRIRDHIPWELGLPESAARIEGLLFFARRRLLGSAYRPGSAPPAIGCRIHRWGW